MARREPVPVMHFDCPHCGWPGGITPDYATGTTRCVGCGREFKNQRTGRAGEVAPAGRPPDADFV